MKKNTLFWSDQGVQEQIIATLTQGNLAITTTDTIFGLLAPLTAQGYSALNHIKGRQNKPYLVLIGGAAQVGEFTTTLSPQAQALIKACWPGPLTIVVKARADLPEFLQSPEGTIALRMPLHAGLLGVLAHFNGLFSTSANFAGQPVADHAADLEPALVDQVALIVDGDAHQSLPSTIVDCTGDAVRIIRAGALSLEEIEKVAGNV